MTDAAEILNGDDYFDCRLRCRMPKAVCIARQTEGIRHQGKYRVIPESCKDCAQGRALLAEQSGLKQTKTIKRRNVRQERKANMKAICENCIRKMTIQRNGRCFTCEKATQGKTGQELAAALLAVRNRIENGELKSWRKKSPAPQNVGAASCREEENAAGAAVGAASCREGSVGAAENIAAKSRSYSREPAQPCEDTTSQIINVGVGLSPAPTVIPVTLRLTVEIAVRVIGISA